MRVTGWLCSGIVGAMLLAATSASAAQHAPARYAPGPAAPALSGLVRAMGANAADAADRRFAYLRKLDSHLQNLEAERLDGGDLAATARHEALTLDDGARSVLVDVYVTGDMGAAKDALRAHGMKISAVSDAQPQRMVEGTLPVDALTDVAGLAGTRAVLAVQGSGSDAGTVLSQGDAVHRGPQARALGPTGAGVTVGVVSNSINRVGAGIAGSQATGNLPGPASTPPGQVQALLDGVPTSNDEGRAMAEIIFDTAPGIRNMLFSTGTSGAATRASGIDNLVAGGAKIIADDVYHLSEPFFQDGAVARAVDRAKAAGVTYLASAGNRARESWEGTYAATTDPRGVSPGANDFDPGAPADAIQTIGTFTNFELAISLQWDEPFNAASTDLAIDFYAISGGVPVYTGITVDSDNIATRVPSEFGGIMSGGTLTIGIAIRRNAGARNPFMKYIVNVDKPAFTIAEHNTSSGAINPDAASARGSLAVAASNHATPAIPEPFSSRGPAIKLFDVAGNRLAAPENRNKPDIAAADGVATSVPGFNPFFGTSAATPSAAGVAALALSARPSLTPEQLAAILKDSRHSIDCTATIGLPDADCGYGFVLADGAVQAARDASPPVVTPAVSPAPGGANGWYRTAPANVSFTVTDPESPLLSKTGCDPASVTTDTTVTFTCVASSIGGTTTTPVTIKRDTTPPAPPAFAGIAARTYTVAQLPAAAAVSCTSSDPTSGIAACVVTGHSAALGAHTLTARATNGAGLTSTATLTYTVVANPLPPFAISALSAAKGRVRIGMISRFGLRATLKAASAQTKLKVTVTLRGKKIASQTKTVKKGTVRLTVRLQRLARARLRAKPGQLEIKVVGSAAGYRTRTLTAKVKTRR